MSTSFTPERSEAIRDLLVQEATRARSPRPHRMLWGTALVLLGALTGAGVSAAAFAAGGAFLAPAVPAGRPSPDLPDAVPAPEGVTPGAPIVSSLGEPQQFAVADATEYPLDPRPEGATHVRVTVSMLEPGAVDWGTDPDGNNPSSGASQADIDRGVATAWMDLPLDSSTPLLYVTPTTQARASVTLQFVGYVPTLLGVNERGETFGVEGGPEGSPDLIAVQGIGPDGASVEGYARAEDLHAVSPEHPGLPSSPEEALAWQEEREREHPDGWDIPVLRSDGVTQIGTFHIGG